MTLRVASFVSGGGTTMEQAFQAGLSGKMMGIEPALVVASKPNIGAIQKAVALQVPAVVLQNPKNPAEIIRIMYTHGIDIIIQNGYIPLMPWEVVGTYSSDFLNPDAKLREFLSTLDPHVREWLVSRAVCRSIFNQHPGCVRADHLDFGGKGMFGARVMAARVLYLLLTRATGKSVFTESTVQYTHTELDKWILIGTKRMLFGEELAQFKESLKMSDPNYVEKLRTFVEGLQKKLLPLEHENVIDILQRVGMRERFEGVPEYYEKLVPKKNTDYLEWSKALAALVFPKG